MSHRWLAVLVMSCIADSAALGGIAAAQNTGPPPGGPAQTVPGLTVTSFSVPAGTVRVSLPDDMAAGDTISGTVVAEPAGRNQRERDANAAVLQGYVVDTGPKKTAVGQRVITFVIPAATTLTLIVRDPRAKALGRSEVPLRIQQAPTGHPPQPQDFRFPQVAVAGQPAVIRGPFTGDFAKSTLTVGGQRADNLAESPRTFVVAPAPNVSGPADYRLAENGIAVTAPCNVLSLTLSAPKTSLARGERITVHVAVGGLTGIREAVNLKLVNSTPNVVALAGGALQVLTIRLSDVGAGGTFGIDRDVTGLGNGAFSLSATLDDRNPPAYVDGQPLRTSRA